MLIEWVNGKSISSAENSSELLARCGNIHYSIHSTHMPDKVTKPYLKKKNTDASKGIELIRSQVEELCEKAILEKSDGKILLKLIETHIPSDFEYGLVAGDFCAENLILNHYEKIFLIDNEKLSIDAYDYDLARTLYRWPMSPDQRVTYLESYNHYRDIKSFKEHFLFWLIKVLLKSINFRLSVGTNMVSVPIDRLNFLLSNVKLGFPSNPELVL